MPPKNAAGPGKAPTEELLVDTKTTNVHIMGSAADAIQPLALLGVDARCAARLVGISLRTFRAMHARGAVPSPVSMGRRRVWRLAELRAWMNAGCPPREHWRWNGEGAP